MGRLVAQIPNEDPARLARVQDAKWRTIGVNLRRCLLACAQRWGLAVQDLLLKAVPVCRSTVEL